MMRQFAMRSSQIDCSAIGLPNATREDRRLQIFSSSALGDADVAHAVMNAAGAETRLRDLEAAALAEQDVVGRHAHVLEHDLGVAVRRVVEAEHRQHAQHLHARRLHRHEDLRLLCMLRGGRVGLAHHDEHLAARVAGAGRPPLAAVDHVVDRLRGGCWSRCWSRRRMRPRARSCRTRSGSRRSSSGLSQRSLFAGEAKRSRISMLPVSGAEQLNTSLDQATRPMISHSGEYSRFVSPAPLAECGRNMFHRPAARAFGLSCSTSGIGSQRALPSRCVHQLRHGFLVRINVLVEECFEARDQRLDLVGVLELHGSPPLCVRGNNSALWLRCRSGFSPTPTFLSARLQCGRARWRCSSTACDCTA